MTLSISHWDTILADWSEDGKRYRLRYEINFNSYNAVDMFAGIIWAISVNWWPYIWLQTMNRHWSNHSWRVHYHCSLSNLLECRGLCSTGSDLWTLSDYLSILVLKLIHISSRGRWWRRPGTSPDIQTIYWNHFFSFSRELIRVFMETIQYVLSHLYSLFTNTSLMLI